MMKSFSDYGIYDLTAFGINGSDDAERKIEMIENKASERTEQQAGVTIQEINPERQAELIKEQKNIIQEQQAELEFLKQKYEKKCLDYEVIANSLFWKITKPARLVLDTAKGLSQHPDPISLLQKGIYSLKRYGIRYTINKAHFRIYHSVLSQNLLKIPLFSEDELKEQKNYIFSRNIKFSIVVPLYNTSEAFLCEMIQSVMAQTYPDWELCMADGSDNEHSYIERICMEYAAHDDRIHYQKLKQNYGISGNTNACLEMAKGDYIGLFDHDDMLHPAALFEVMHAICDTDADIVYTDESTFHKTPEDANLPHFKPAYAPDNLRANNYICHFTVFKKSLLEKTGMFDSAFDGSQDYDMILRLTENADRIAHIPEILYYWRAHSGSVAREVSAKPYALEAGKRAIESHLQRIGLPGKVQIVDGAGTYRIRYKIHGTPRISILIPNCDHYRDLQTCLDSIFEKTTYSNYEIIIVENNSSSTAIFSYYKKLQEERENVHVVTWESTDEGVPFNYSAINNLGARYCTGEYIVLLNNDTKVISKNWLQEMLMFAQRKDVGAVGAKLYYPDNTIQHAGIGLGILTLAGHYFRGFHRSSLGYMRRLRYAQNVSAVTAACMMLRRDVWDEMNGLDESFAVAFNDVDLCLRIRKAGYLIVWTPFAELYHYESKSRGYDTTPQKKKRAKEEIKRFLSKWQKELNIGDPYYNPNFSLEREDFSIDSRATRHRSRTCNIAILRLRGKS